MGINAKLQERAETCSKDPQAEQSHIILEYSCDGIAVKIWLGRCMELVGIRYIHI